MEWCKQLINRFSAGQSLVEILVALGISALIIPAIYLGLLASRQGQVQLNQRQNALTLLNESLEAVRVVREKKWTTFAVDGTYYPATQAGGWVLMAGTQTIGDFTRSLTISDVSRDSTGKIVSSGGQIDPSTKKVTHTVSWSVPYSGNVSVTTYMTRYLDNDAYLQTTQTDFKAGTQSGTAVVATTGTGVPDDGQVQLGAGGLSDWCAPNLTIAPLDLPGQGITTAISATTSAAMDYAYTTTGGNSSGDSMDAMMISHDNPPIASYSGMYNYFKTYGIYVDVANKYVYLTSDHPGMTVDIVQVSSQPYSEVGTFSASGGGQGNTVITAFNAHQNYEVGYVTAGSYLYAIDLSSKNGARPQLGQVQLGGTGQRVFINGNYAYVAVSSATEQMDIINITDPANMSKVSQINVGNSQNGVDLTVSSDGSRTYLITSQGSPQRNDFFIINTESKIATLPVPLGAYNSGAMNPKGVITVSGNHAIIVGSGGEQYQVLNIVNEATPALCGGLTNPNGATSVNAVAGILRNDGSAYAYILTNTASQELQIIQGGPGGSVSLNGSFESFAFNAGYSTAFNRFIASVSQPKQTGIKMQVGVAASIGGACNNIAFTYVGPGGDPAAYFTPVEASISGVIPFGTYAPTYTNPGQCFRYKVFFSSSDQSQSPIFYDMTANYSP